MLCRGLGARFEKGIDEELLHRVDVPLLPKILS
jgi:hypothetical protein